MWPVDLDDAGSVLVVEVLYPDIHPDPEVSVHIFPVPEAKIRLHSALYVRLGEKDKRLLCTRTIRGAESLVRWKIRLIEGNAKCRHLKNLNCKKTLRQVFICLQNTLPPPPYTLFTCIQYTYSHREDGEGGESNQREGEKCNSSQSRVENTNMTYFISSI